jgi:hypothetical protein
MTITDLGNAQFRSYSGGMVAGRLENQHSWNIGSGSSITAGGTGGCNWQPVGSPFVLGIEGEAGYLKLQVQPLIRFAVQRWRQPHRTSSVMARLATGME